MQKILVRNRDEAQVQVLITTMPTGSGGRQFTLIFLGRKHFQGVDDTLEYVSRPSESWDDIRKGVSNTISLGLIRYVEQMPIAKYLSVDVSKSDSDTVVKDKMIHDQLSLPQTGATTDQILLQQTELATQYSYWTEFGVSYTFGSIYNDVVNPRLW